MWSSVVRVLLPIRTKQPGHSPLPLTGRALSSTELLRTGYFFKAILCEPQRWLCGEIPDLRFLKLDICINSHMNKQTDECKLEHATFPMYFFCYLILREGEPKVTFYF